MFMRLGCLMRAAGCRSRTREKIAKTASKARTCLIRKDPGFRRCLRAGLATLLAAAPVSAQQPAPTPAGAPTTVCGQEVGPPAAQPPAGSSPVVYLIVPCFEAQGGTPVIDPATYLYYIHLKPSRPSQGIWTSYDENAEKT